MRAAAQLEAVVGHAHGPDRLPVLLVEERVRARLDRLADREERDGHRSILANHPADLVLDPRAARPP